MTVLLWVLGYLAVGLVAAVLCFRYVFEDYDRDHFAPLLLWAVWPIIVPLFVAANSDFLRGVFRACARRLP